MKDEGDWTGWSLHLIFGFAVGAFFFGGSALKVNLSFQSALPLAIGAGLALGGIGSYYGDELWNGESYRVIPPDEMQRSKSTVLASRVVGGIGFAILLWGWLQFTEF